MQQQLRFLSACVGVLGLATLGLVVERLLESAAAANTAEKSFLRSPADTLVTTDASTAVRKPSTELVEGNETKGKTTTNPLQEKIVDKFLATRRLWGGNDADVVPWGWGGRSRLGLVVILP